LVVKVVEEVVGPAAPELLEPGPPGTLTLADGPAELVVVVVAVLEVELAVVVVAVLEVELVVVVVVLLVVEEVVVDDAAHTPWGAAYRAKLNDHWNSQSVSSINSIP
jgi:hypothetical protein